MTVGGARTIPDDWYPGTIPDNVQMHGTAHVETSFSFYLFRSELETGARIGHAASVYLGTMLDVGRRGCVIIGDFALLNGTRVICDAAIEIGDYCLISWGVVLMDTYRVPFDKAARRRVLEDVSALEPRRIDWDGPRRQAVHEAAHAARPIRIGRNVWVGFDACVLPGVTIGEGSVVGARSVVAEDVPPYSIVAGNPARVIRRIEPDRPKGERP